MVEGQLDGMDLFVGQFGVGLIQRRSRAYEIRDPSGRVPELADPEQRVDVVSRHELVVRCHRRFARRVRLSC